VRVGIESDQLVYDYLSRVGDAAQQQQLPSGTRMRLVSTLRNEIDRQRGKSGSDSPAAVRRIIGRMGTPHAVVEAASTGGGADRQVPPLLPDPAVPEQRTGRGEQQPREAEPGIPHQQSGPAGGGPDWWRMELRTKDESSGVPGFIGGIEIPELLGVPSQAVEKDPEEAAVPGEQPAAGARRWRLRRRTGGGQPDEQPEKTETAGKKARGLANPLLLLAAVLLVVGAVLGSWLALAGGWLLAYASRRLSRAEAKWVVFGLPGVSLAGGLVWLWGRTTGRWGEPIPDGGMGEALSGVWPVVIRTAAVTSALYLLWRARRR
jgi:hypothetical protein